VFDFGEEPQPLVLDVPPVLAEENEESSQNAEESPVKPKKTVPPKHDEIIWAWKPELETTRRTFFL